MRPFLTTAVLLGSTALAAGAFAQTPAPQPGVPTAAPSALAGSGLTASALRNQPVYGSNGQEIGRVASVVIGADNQPYAVMTGGSFGNRQALVPASRLSYANNRFTAGNLTEEQIRTLPAYTQGAGGFRVAEDTFAVAVVGYTVAQAGQRDGTQITVQQPAPAIRVEQASPNVTVQQAQPQVTVRQAQPEILVRQPAPTVTVDIPQPEIIVRMPQPEVNVAQAQPQVQVSQAQPNVQVVQPAQPQVQVTPAQPQVMVQRPLNAEANVQVQSPGQPNVRFERAEPRVTVNQAQGQPNVRIEQQATAGQGVAAGGATGAAERRRVARERIGEDAAATGTVAAPARPAQTRTIRAREMENLNIYNARGERLGDVERVIVNPADNRQYAVIGRGGFLGLFEDEIALPVDRLFVRGDRILIRGVTDQELDQSPEWRTRFPNARELEDNASLSVSVEG